MNACTHAQSHTHTHTHVHRAVDSGESYGEFNGYGTLNKRTPRNPLSKLIHPVGGVGADPSASAAAHALARVAIGMPADFRRVSAIIDVDVVPATQRRVRLMRNGSDRPLGFYIRDGSSVRLTALGVEKTAGIFISRLVPGGLAEGTGLLAVNDEVLEVNGIDVRGKTLDQVTDMMVANSANLIITVKPVNQRNNLVAAGAVMGVGGGRYASSSSAKSSLRSATSLDSDDVREVTTTTHDDDDDVVHDYLTPTGGAGGGEGARESGGDGESGGGEGPDDDPVVTL